MMNSLKNVHCFTSITNNYLPKACILAETLKSHHPEWKFDLVIAEPFINLGEENFKFFDNIITIDDLNFPYFNRWVFNHSVMEICTAIKGQSSYYIFNTLGAEIVVYLDPDIAVFNSLQELIDLLENYPIIFTPHQNKPSKDYDSIFENEVCSLKHGVYNLGFFAISNFGQGKEFLDWWRQRLYYFCYIDFSKGLFTDQRWCDLAPVFFDKLYILRKSEYNVATWNISHREITMAPDGTILVDGSPMRFYHFSSYDSGAGLAAAMKYTHEDNIIREIWNYYTDRLNFYSHKNYNSLRWKYDFFTNGEQITQPMRELYRNRKDLQDNFLNPFDTNRPDGGYLAWYREPRNHKKFA